MNPGQRYLFPYLNDTLKRFTSFSYCHPLASNMFYIVDYKLTQVYYLYDVKRH